jgi:hypothetical protein
MCVYLSSLRPTRPEASSWWSFSSTKKKKKRQRNQKKRDDLEAAFAVGKELEREKKRERLFFALFHFV